MNTTAGQRSFVFEFGWIPNSSKNRKRIVRNRKTGKPFLVTESKVLREMKEIGERAAHAGAPYFEDDELAIDVKLDYKRKRTRIEIVSLGPRPKGRTGRGKDGDNVLSTILDALNGVVYRDDSQFRRLRIERYPEGLDGLFHDEDEF